MHSTSPDPTLLSDASASLLRVGGFVPFTTTDFPGKLAAVVFCQGCPWRCGYCHNPHLQAAHAEDASASVTWPSILDWLRTRRGLLDGVVFSGGEPTAQPEIAPAIAAVRDLQFAVALHTAGIYPRRLAAIAPLLDWVGLDIKAPLTSYPAVTGVDGSGSVAFASLDVLQRARVPFEVRTTVHHVRTPPRALISLAAALADQGITQWVLQPFRATGCADPALVASAGEAGINATLLDELRAHVPEVTVR
jgi:anaerobic ribonucleoside-triphosphate reductase activating protein